MVSRRVICSSAKVSPCFVERRGSGNGRYFQFFFFNLNCKVVENNPRTPLNDKNQVKTLKSRENKVRLCSQNNVKHPKITMARDRIKMR